MNILEIYTEKNTWTPQEIDEYALVESMAQDVNAKQGDGFVYVFRTQPYIDSVYARYDENRKPVEIKRFAFHEGYIWSNKAERAFDEYCVNNKNCAYNGGAMDEIFTYYSKLHPEWHLKRYYTKGIRLLDHIYHCMKKNTAKELLYKSGLDELAVGVYQRKNINLIASNPSEIYDGLSMKVLRSLNCEYGALLLNNEKCKEHIKDLDATFPNLLKTKLNDAQCKYLAMLIRGDLTVGETGRLFGSRKDSLAHAWSAGFADNLIGQYISKCREQEREQREHEFAQMMKYRERSEHELMQIMKKLERIDPIYKKCLKSARNSIEELRHYLLNNRKDYDKAIARSNRKRIYEWQERTEGYMVRYPQTINDFCREAIYMQNCLLAYVEPYINNDTTLLFMRKKDDINMPSITIEIYKNELMQAYHRFNEDCTKEEANWIREYCRRHGIDCSRYQFDKSVDRLF